MVEKGRSTRNIFKPAAEELISKFEVSEVAYAIHELFYKKGRHLLIVSCCLNEKIMGKRYRLIESFLVDRRELVKMREDMCRWIDLMNNVFEENS